MQQLTLTGEETDQERERPETFTWCESCEDFVFSHNWNDHEEHHQNILEEKGLDTDTEDNEDAALKVGGEYKVRIEKSVTWEFHEVAYGEAEAKDRASLKVDYGNAVDAMNIHEEVTEIEEIYEDDERAEKHNLRP